MKTSMHEPPREELQHPLLPTELPLRDALRLYGKRMAIFLGVVVLSLVVLVIGLLVFQYPGFLKILGVAISGFVALIIVGLFAFTLLSETAAYHDYATLPNLLVTGNLVAGFLAVLLIFRGDYFPAAGLISVAAILDVLDGVAARRADNGDDAFGTNLDSLADLVSFGAAPALALYMSTLYVLPVVGVVACLAFLLCGAWRLARFSTCKNSLYFVGCPIPGAGVLISLLAALGTPPLVALPAVLLLSVLMIGTMPFPTLSGLRNREELSEKVEEYRRQTHRA